MHSAIHLLFSIVCGLLLLGCHPKRYLIDTQQNFAAQQQQLNQLFLPYHLTFRKSEQQLWLQIPTAKLFKPHTTTFTASGWRLLQLLTAQLRQQSFSLITITSNLATDNWPIVINHALVSQPAYQILRHWRNLGLDTRVIVLKNTSKFPHNPDNSPTMQLTERSLDQLTFKFYQF